MELLLSNNRRAINRMIIALVRLKGQPPLIRTHRNLLNFGRTNFVGLWKLNWFHFAPDRAYDSGDRALMELA